MFLEKKASQELLAAKTRLAKKGHKKNKRRPDKHEKSPAALTPSQHQEQDHANNASAIATGGPDIVPVFGNAGERVKDGLVVLADGDLGGGLVDMVSNAKNVQGIILFDTLVKARARNFVFVQNQVEAVLVAALSIFARLARICGFMLFFFSYYSEFPLGRSRRF